MQHERLHDSYDMSEIVPNGSKFSKGVPRPSTSCHECHAVTGQGLTRRCRRRNCCSHLTHLETAEILEQIMSLNNPLIDFLSPQTSWLILFS